MRSRFLLASFFAAGLLISALAGGCPVVTTGANLNQNTAARTTGNLELLAPRRVFPIAETNIPTQFVRLQWSIVPGATAYEVHVGVDTNPPLVAIVNLSDFTIRELPACTRNYWRIVALKDDQPLISSATYVLETHCDGAGATPNNGAAFPTPSNDNIPANIP